jgi:hypothetical protein
LQQAGAPSAQKDIRSVSLSRPAIFVFADLIWIIVLATALARTGHLSATAAQAERQFEVEPAALPPVPSIPEVIHANENEWE